MAEARRQPHDTDRPDLAAPVPPVPAGTIADSAQALGVTSEPVGDRLVVLRVSGEVDMLTAPTLADHVRRHFDGPARALVFDLTGVDFLGSAGLAVLAEAATHASEAGVPIRVVATSHAVLRPLQVTGLDGVLATTPDVATAVRECES